MATTRRTTRTHDVVTPDELKNILKGISLKLDGINECLQKLCETQQNDQERKTTAYKTMEKSINSIEQNMVTIINKRESASLKNEALKQRHNITTWKRQLNKRKELFWQSLNCGNTAIIYETWLDKEKKIIPNKLLLKFIPNEDPQEKRIRQHMVTNKLQAEINLLNIRAERHHTNYKKIDEEMSNFLEKKFEGDILSELQNLWVKECKSEETKSHDKWKRKQLWLEKYEEEFKSNDFIKPRNDRNTNRERRGNNPTTRVPTANYHQQKLKFHQLKPKFPRSEQNRRKNTKNSNYTYQSQRNNKTPTARGPQEKRSQKFPRKQSTEDKKNGKYLTYADVVRGSYRNTREEFKPQSNRTNIRGNRKQDYYFLASTHGGNHPPIRHQRFRQHR